MEQRKFRMPTAYTILFCLILLVALSTWLIPAGSYDYADGIPISGSYHAVAPAPQGIGAALKAAFRGFYDAVDVCVFILMVGGFLGVVMKTGAIDAGVSKEFLKREWKRAMEAAMDAINCVETSETTGAYTMDGRRLGLSINTNSSVTDQSERGRINYTYVFTGDGNSTQFLNQNEYLMSMNKSSSITYTQRQFGCHLANSYTKVSAAYRGYSCPTIEAVEMYYTENGLPWEDDPETKDIDPYSYNEEAGTVNLHLYKEPRFYASVGYDRGTYRFNGGKMTIKARKGEPQGFTGSYDNEYQSYNGYFCQKWVNEQSKAKLNSSGNYAVDTYMYYVYPYMRVAELYLSYAEADFEYDGTLSDYGYECLNKIRSRCGLPTFQESWSKAGGIPTGDKLRDIIRRERSIEFMLEGRPAEASGAVTACSMEGTRPILLEVQALVSKTNFGLPRRTAAGVDYNRVNLLMAVLEKRCRYALSGYDAYVNIAGGMKMNEPALDLAIVMALISSYKDRPLDEKTIVFGEVGLSGEVRAVSMAEQRVHEAVKMGFTRCILPMVNVSKLKPRSDIRLEGVANVREAIGLL